MPTAHHIQPRNGDTIVLVGTMKGAFVFSGEQMGGPYFPGSAVYAMAYDRGRLWAAPESMHWGGLLRTSDDFGRTWTNPEEANIKFPEGTGAALKQIWQITITPEAMYCGVEPAALFVSHDRGESWSLVEGLWNHPQRPRWEPGGGGLCLHTILPDPVDAKRIRIAVSTGGMYVTEDGGESWRPSNKGVRAQFLPNKYPEFGQCVHKVVQSKRKPERMYLQNHWGLYRSDDRGESWTDMANGVPSDFGFAMGIHPDDPETAWIVPLESDEFRCTPEGRLRVYRTRNGGTKWEAMSEGLPQEDAFETVLRDCLAVSGKHVFFGTRSGKLFGSSDEGTTWSQIRQGLPPIVAVKTAVV